MEPFGDKTIYQYLFVKERSLCSIEIFCEQTTFLDPPIVPFDFTLLGMASGRRLPSFCGVGRRFG